MRKMIVCLGVVGLVAFAGRGLAPVPVQAADKVTICHFPGHGDQSLKGAADYIVGPKGDFGGCEKRGGNLISISVNALPAHGIDTKCDPNVEKCL